MDVDSLIDGVRTPEETRCRVCAQPKLAPVVLRWLDRRAAGENLPSLTTMTEQLFQTLGDCSPTGLRRHIRACLGRDHLTGKTL